MPIILIKNNLKLMLRSKWILFMMSILPLITIALLSSAFKDALSNNYKMSEFQVGYRVSKSSIYKDMLPMLQTVCKDNGVIMTEYPDEDIDELLKNKSVTVFVDIKDNSYKVYESSEQKTEAAVMESILSSFFYKANETLTLMSYGKAPELSISPAAGSIVYEKLNTEPVPTSNDYYGIIYIVYFTWCGMVSLVAVISSERKNVIPRRMRVSRLTRWHYYLGKLIPCTLATFIEICIAWILSVILYDIHWGQLPASIAIMFLTSLAASAFGIVLFQLFKNVAVSIVAGFALVWTAGFFGGSFMSYIYSFLPQKLMKLSPIYFTDRTLVEFSTKGYSDYAVGCYVFLAAIIVVCSILGTLLMNRRFEEV